MGPYENDPEQDRRNSLFRDILISFLGGISGGAAVKLSEPLYKHVTKKISDYEKNPATYSEKDVLELTEKIADKFAEELKKYLKENLKL